MLGSHAGEDINFSNQGIQLIIAQLVQLGPGKHTPTARYIGFERRTQDADLAGNRRRGRRVVAGHHDGAQASFARFLNGGLHFRTGRINHALQAQENQIAFDFSRIRLIRDSLQGAIGHAQDAQRLRSHSGVGSQNLLAFFLRQGHDALIAQNPGAVIEHHIRRTLDDGHIARITGTEGTGIIIRNRFKGVNGTHALALSIKGDFGHTRIGLFQGLAPVARFSPGDNQSAFSRIPYHAVLRSAILFTNHFQIGVVTEHTGPEHTAQDIVSA